MKLYDVPNDTNIRIASDAMTPPVHREFMDGEVLRFHHLDGMYSLCTDSCGQIVHLAGWAEVEIVEDEEE